MREEFAELDRLIREEHRAYREFVSEARGDAVGAGGRVKPKSVMERREDWLSALVAVDDEADRLAGEGVTREEVIRAYWDNRQEDAKKED